MEGIRTRDTQEAWIPYGHVTWPHPHLNTFSPSETVTPHAAVETRVSNKRVVFSVEMLHIAARFCNGRKKKLLYNEVACEQCGETAIGLC
jgi:hypothetical protein